MTLCRLSSNIDYKKSKDGNQSTAKSFQEIRCMGSRQRNNFFPQQNGKYNIKKEELGTNENHNKEPNHTLQGK